LLVSFDLGLQGYDKTRGEQFQKQIIERVSALPGVQSAALADLFPLSMNYSSNGIFIEGHPPLRGTDVPNAMVASVSSDYFKTMEIPMLAGRAFTQQDDAKATQAAIVNEAFIRKLMPELKSLDEAIGKRFSYRAVDGPFMQIIGVARDGKYWTIGEASQPFSYTPLLQSYSSSTTMVIRTTIEPRSLLTSVQREFQSLDETLPVFGSKTLEEHLGISLFPTRVAAMLLGSFGGIALILAAICIYGVMAYSVAQRTREIGIRMALGAQTTDVLAMILKQGARLVSIGLVIGLLAAFALTNFMSSVLYGVSATDLWTFAIVSAALIGVALGACFLPARRAAKTNPIIALRYE
jgi:predicted permease